MRKIILFLIVFIVGCSGVVDENLIIEEYHQGLIQFNKLILEHAEIGLRINENPNVNPDIHKQAVDEYLVWIRNNKLELENFKSFIEENYLVLKTEGRGHVLVRDTIKILLEDIEKNENDFKIYNRIWERYNK